MRPLGVRVRFYTESQRTLYWDEYKSRLPHLAYLGLTRLEIEIICLILVCGWGALKIQSRSNGKIKRRQVEKLCEEYPFLREYLKKQRESTDDALDHVCDKEFDESFQEDQAS